MGWASGKKRERKGSLREKREWAGVAHAGRGRERQAGLRGNWAGVERARE
jgi:hypothetical protein